MEFIAVAGLYSGVRSEPQKITPYQGLEPVYLRRFFYSRGTRRDLRIWSFGTPAASQSR